jgi:hypothetical protein
MIFQYFIWFINKHSHESGFIPLQYDIYKSSLFQIKIAKKRGFSKRMYRITNRNQLSRKQIRLGSGFLFATHTYILLHISMYLCT